jgi:hypothetical protein
MIEQLNKTLSMRNAPFTCVAERLELLLVLIDRVH